MVKVHETKDPIGLRRRNGRNRGENFSVSVIWRLTVAGGLMLAKWMMFVLFYLILVVPFLWRFSPPKLVTPY